MQDTVTEPFTVQTLQVALVTPDLKTTLQTLGALGIGPFAIYTLGPDNARDLMYRGEPADFSFRYALGACAGMAWEVIQPLSGESIYAEFLAEHGAGGFHHIAVDCSGVPFDGQVAELNARGYHSIQSGTAFDGAVRFAYFHTNKQGAPIVEIFESPPGLVIEDHAEEWFPPAPSLLEYFESDQLVAGEPRRALLKECAHALKEVGGFGALLLGYGLHVEQLGQCRVGGRV